MLFPRDGVPLGYRVDGLLVRVHDIAVLAATRRLTWSAADVQPARFWLAASVTALDGSILRIVELTPEPAS